MPSAEAQQVMAKPRIELLQENNVRKGFFEREQFESVRAHLPEDLQPVATFSYITGWRKNEVLNLQWSQVDFDAGFVHLEPGTTKSDEARMFPLTKDLRAVLESQRAKADALKKEVIICPWVFHRGGKKSNISGVPGRAHARLLVFLAVWFMTSEEPQ